MAMWQRFKPPSLLAIILLLTAGLYIQVWQHTLVWDEHALTAQQVVLHPSWAHYQRSVQETYRPVALLSVVADHLIWRGWPPGYAVNGLLYHLAVVALFFYVIRGWVAPFPAVASTMIVAIHPAGAETVHYLLGRPDLLSVACLLAALLAFRRLDHADRWPVALALFWGFGVLAFAAKETALLLPGLALVLCFTQMESMGEKSGGKESGRIRRRVIALAPFVLLACLYISARGGGWIAVGTPMHLHLGVEQLAVMAATAAAALNILFFPVDLCPWYEGRIPIPSSAWLAAGALLIGLAGIIYLIWRFRQRAPAVSVGLAWLTGMLALIAIRAATDPAPMNPLAVRWLYPAVIGTALIIGGLLQWIEPLWPRISRAAAVCGLLVLTGLTWQAQPVWQDDISLFHRATECNPRSAFITLQSIDVLNNAGLKDQADQLFARLLAQQPNHPRVLSYLVRLAIGQGNYSDAIDRVHALIQAAPSALSYRTLGDLSALTDQPDAAIKAYRMALRYQSTDMLTLIALGNIYEKNDQWEEAVALYHDGLTGHHDAVNLWFRLGRTSEQAGRLQEAALAFDQVTQFDHNCPDGYLAEARVQEKLGNRRASEETIKRYTELTHQGAIPRPIYDPLDSPCGNEPKVIYQKKTSAMSLSPAPDQPASP